MESLRNRWRMDNYVGARRLHLDWLISKYSKTDGKWGKVNFSRVSGIKGHTQLAGTIAPLSAMPINPDDLA